MARGSGIVRRAGCGRSARPLNVVGAKLLHEDAATDAMLDLLRGLDEARYAFVTPTPATHARVVARPDRREARSLRDVFGWSLPFAPGLIDARLVAVLGAAGALERRGDLLASRLRASCVHGALFLHSAFPTDQADAVFLGPDSYRFADFIRARGGGTAEHPRVLDIGAGAGVGACVAGLIHRGARLTMTDINPAALRLASANARFNGLATETIATSGVDGVAGPFDLIVANPPFIVDPAARAYRDGGDMHGGRMSLDWALAAAPLLAPGGRMLLYTGSAIVEGRDALCEALAAGIAPLGATLEYAEIDPDIFGEELDNPGYGDVDRIAAVGAVITREGQR